MTIGKALNLTRQQVYGHLGQWASAQKAADKRAVGAARERRVVHIEIDPRRVILALDHSFQHLDEDGSFWDGFGVAMRMKGDEERADAGKERADVRYSLANEVREIANYMREQIAKGAAE